MFGYSSGEVIGKKLTTLIMSPRYADLFEKEFEVDELADKLDLFLKSCFGTIEKANRRLIRTIDSILNMAQILTAILTLKTYCLIRKNNTASETFVVVINDSKLSSCYSLVWNINFN